MASRLSATFGRSSVEYHHPIVLEDYFSGPMDPNEFSNLPYFVRLHGSVLPRMILPLILVGAWATMITCISKYIVSLGVNSVLLTVLGFVVGLALSFRSSTAYERYAEGRKYWAQMILTTRNLARLVWVHAKEREGENGKEDLIGKLTCINMILGFVVAVKYRLRRQPDYEYPDLKPLVQNMWTLAKSAYISDGAPPRKTYSTLRKVAQRLGVPGAQSDPCKPLRRGPKYYGNLPLEIMTYLGSYMEICVTNGTINTPIMQTTYMNSMTTLLDCLTGMERVLSTPLPLAFNIAISQITWAYILILPFQLYQPLGWIAIPGTLAAAYIILGIAAIGREIENPFGSDVNDLDMEGYIRSLAVELDIMTSMPPPKAPDFIATDENCPLGPTSKLPYSVVKEMSIETIRGYLKERVARHKSQMVDQNIEKPIDHLNISTGVV